MKALRNLFGSLKRHWEKFVLGLALIGLIGAVIYLNQMKSEENATIEKYEEGVKKPKVKPFPTIDAKMLTDAMDHANKPPSLNFSPPHNLFNPVKWQKRVATGQRIKAETGKELGIKAVVYTKITPLSTTVTLDNQTGSGAQMSITQQASTNRYLQQRLRDYVSTNSTPERIHKASRSFTLRDIRVTADGAEADIELTSDGTKATVTSSKPFTRVEGYKADLLYPPENQSFKDRRVGDAFTVAGEDYIIVAISENEVVVSARSNDRRTTIQNAQ